MRNEDSAKYKQKNIANPHNEIRELRHVEDIVKWSQKRRSMWNKYINSKVNEWQKW